MSQVLLNLLCKLSLALNFQCLLPLPSGYRDHRQGAPHLTSTSELHVEIYEKDWGDWPDSKVPTTQHKDLPLAT